MGGRKTAGSVCIHARNDCRDGRISASTRRVEWSAEPSRGISSLHGGAKQQCHKFPHSIRTTTRHLTVLEALFWTASLLGGRRNLQSTPQSTLHPDLPPSLLTCR